MNAIRQGAFVLLLIMGLGGCAGTGGMGPSGSADGQSWVTRSEEPEARKRARVRLELATGYFEQGQTTVALDEVKQAINIDRGFGPAYNLQGLIFMRLNEPRLAEASFQQALRISARDADTLHNLGWLYCQEARYDEALRQFGLALQVPNYAAAARTWMAQGVCQARAGRLQAAEDSLLRSFELDAGNPITNYNLALLLHQRGEHARAQFYIRRLNNSELANAESLWLGIKVERALGNREAVGQLADQLRRRFPESSERSAYDRGVFE
jgi:type IV pilus assembly protein PilF